MTDAIDDVPVTAATRAADALGLAYEVRVIERARSAEEAAERIGVAPDRLLKTMVVRRAADDYLLVLVPGPAQIDWPKLRSHLGVSRLSMPDAGTALDATGYERGTITPLGTNHEWPVVADRSIVGGGIVSIGAGEHGVALLVDADELITAIGADSTSIT